jgi:L-amino acid N-acyltransferase YncA/AcrR family transcriptional regulator
MAVDPDRRAEILDAAAEEFAARSIASVSRRDVAKAADVPQRAVTEVGPHRIDLLRQIVEDLPFPPVAQSLAAQARHPSEPALQALLRAARDVLGDPGVAWDPLELQALMAAPYDEPMREVVADRLERRWAAARDVVRQMRRPAAEDVIGDDAAALHLIAVGLGLAVLSPVSAHWSDARPWTALTARLLETLAADDADGVEGEATRWRARVQMADSSSSMAHLFRVLSLLKVRVVSLFTAPLTEGTQLVDMFLASAPDVERATLAHALSSVGSEPIVSRGIVADAEDIATRVLRLSARLVHRPNLAPQAAAELVLADSWEVTWSSEGADSSDFILRLQWTPETHVVLRRVRAPFTPTERNRASALLALVAELAEVRGDADAYGWREPLHDGRTVVIRLGRPDDTAGVEALHERCSPESRYQRYFAPMSEWREDNLRRISGGHRGATLVVTDAQGLIIALGNVFPIGPDETEVAELALIVDDAWHGVGVGRLLMDRLIQVARRVEFTELVAYVLGDNAAMIGLLDATDLDWHGQPDPDIGPGVVRLTARL